MANGGKRPGAGRKPKADEEKAQRLAISAIVKKYKTEQLGFKALLDSGDSTLVRWVYEHAYGKPKEKVEMKHAGGIEIVFKKANAS